MWDPPPATSMRISSRNNAEPSTAWRRPTSKKRCPWRPWYANLTPSWPPDRSLVTLFAWWPMVLCPLDNVCFRKHNEKESPCLIIITAFMTSEKNSLRLSRTLPLRKLKICSNVSIFRKEFNIGKKSAFKESLIYQRQAVPSRVDLIRRQLFLVISSVYRSVCTKRQKYRFCLAFF